jgi:SAM-dependent methyltransferase
MIFDAGPVAYHRFIGRFADRLAPLFADLAGVGPGQRALDVGSGPGALTVELARRLGADAVCAVEPSPRFAAVVEQRLPGVDVRQATAEQLPFGDGAFDVTLAQLVVHFMADPVAGLREMGRVTRPGGRVAACVWDHGGDRGPLTLFWQAVRELDPSARDESGLAGVREGALARLFTEAGLSGVQPGALTVQVPYLSFGKWWEPFTLGVGPAGTYVAALPPERREQLREQCRQRLGPGPIEISGTAWTATGRP